MEGWAGDYGNNTRATTVYNQQQVPRKPVDPIENASDDALVFELIKRGYAVAKMSPDKLVEASE